MGLDQYLYAKKDDVTIQLGYWRKEYQLDEILKEMWIERGMPGNNRLSYFNEVPVYLSLHDLQRIFKLTLDDELSQWDDLADYFRGKTEAILDVALQMLRAGWEIYYISDY